MQAVTDKTHIYWSVYIIVFAELFVITVSALFIPFKPKVIAAIIYLIYWFIMIIDGSIIMVRHAPIASKSFNNIENRDYLEAY